MANEKETMSRTPRAAETRAKEERRKPWRPPSSLDAPPAPDGFKHRWIRTELRGQEDRKNLSNKLREGYELVRADEYPDFEAPTIEDGKHAGVLAVGGLVLARIPEETVAERSAYFQQRSNDQLAAVDQNMMRENAHSSMRIENPQRNSKVSFGGPKSSTD